MWFWKGFQPYSQFIASSSKDRRPAGDPNISKWCIGLALWEQRQKALPALNLTDPRLERCRGSTGHLFSKRPLTAHHLGSFEQSQFSSSSIYIYAIMASLGRQLCSPLWHTFRRLIDQVQVQVNTEHSLFHFFVPCFQCSRFNMIVLKPIWNRPYSNLET